MANLVKQYRNMSFEQKTIFYARFSIIFNLILAIGKFILGFFVNGVFFVTSVINLFMMLSRYECYLGVTKPNKKSFLYRNNLIAVFLMLAGLQYTFYMVLLLLSHFETRSYTMFTGTTIAFVSFVEMGVAIKGCFNAYGKGHYYRNIKMINLCSAMTAIALTEMAIVSFAGDGQNKNLDCWFGIGVGLLIILMGIYAFIAPKISIVDYEHNVYMATENVDKLEKTINIKLTNSKFYGNYYYKGEIQAGILDGKIIQEKTPILQWNIGIKIILVILSEILIFPYAIGALIYHFKNAWLIKKLDETLLNQGFIKIEEREEYDPYLIG